MRPAPIGECRVEVRPTTSAAIQGTFRSIDRQRQGIARFTALMQREDDSPIPAGTPGHPPPQAPKPPDQSPVVKIPYGGLALGYGHLVENRSRRDAFSMDPPPPGFA